MEQKKGRYGLYGGQYIPETLIPQSMKWRKHTNTIRMTHNSSRNYMIC